MRKKLASNGKTGSGRSIYPVTTGFLLKIEMDNDNTLTVLPAWPAEADVTELPGVEVLTAKQHISIKEFAIGAAKLCYWGEQQVMPCRFTVDAVRKTDKIMFT